MSDTTKRKKPNMIHIGIGILTVLLVVFIVILMQLVSNIQGTARVVNYSIKERFPWASIVEVYMADTLKLPVGVDSFEKIRRNRFLEIISGTRSV